MSGKKKFTFGKLKIILIVCVLVYVCVTYANQQNSLTAAREKQESLLAQEAAVVQELEFKTDKLGFIGSDEYVEQEIRKRLGWLKEDEIKYVETTDENLIASSQSTPVPDESANPEESADPEQSTEPVESSESEESTDPQENTGSEAD